MRSKRFIFLCAMVFFVLASASTAFAASSGVATVTASISTGIAITMPTTVTITPSAVPGGSAVTTSFAITVQTNDPSWNLTVAKTGGDLKNQSDNYTIPTSQFTYTSAVSANGTGVGSATQIGGTPASGTAATGQTGATVTMTYNLSATYNDHPGNYITTHTYTATAL